MISFGLPPVSSATIIAALGYTPINKAGDTGIGTLAFASSSQVNWNSDIILARDTANTLAQRNGTSGQTFRLYNTYTDALNFERGALQWNANVLQFGTESAGTGNANRVLRLNAGGNLLTLDPGTGTTTMSRQGGSAAALFELTSGGSGLTNSLLKFAKFTPTIQQCSTNGYTVIDIDVTETSTGSGNKYLIDGRVGGVSRFTVATNGALSCGGISLGANVIGFTERADPGNPGANQGHLYLRDRQRQDAARRRVPERRCPSIATEP
jgi:hypothetical protein